MGMALITSRTDWGRMKEMLSQFQFPLALIYWPTRLFSSWGDLRVPFQEQLSFQSGEELSGSDNFPQTFIKKGLWSLTRSPSLKAWAFRGPGGAGRAVGEVFSLQYPSPWWVFPYEEFPVQLIPINHVQFVFFRCGAPEKVTVHPINFLASAMALEEDWINIRLPDRESKFDCQPANLSWILWIMKSKSLLPRLENLSEKLKYLSNLLVSKKPRVLQMLFRVEVGVFLEKRIWDLSLLTFCNEKFFMNWSWILGVSEWLV